MLKKFSAAMAAFTFVSVAYVGGASATDFDRDIVITATDFSAGAPVTSVILSFNIDLDPSLNSGTTQKGLDVTSFNLPDNVEYNYAANIPSIGPEILTVGSNVGIASFDDSKAGEFGVFIDNAFSDDPSVIGFSFTNALGTFTPGSLGITYKDVAPVPPAAPEPGTWALLLAGVAVAGGALRLGHRKTGLLFRCEQHNPGPAPVFHLCSVSFKRPTSALSATTAT